MFYIFLLLYNIILSANPDIVVSGWDWKLKKCIGTSLPITDHFGGSLTWNIEHHWYRNMRFYRKLSGFRRYFFKFWLQAKQSLLCCSSQWFRSRPKRQIKRLQDLKAHNVSLGATLWACRWAIFTTSKTFLFWFNGISWIILVYFLINSWIFYKLN